MVDSQPPESMLGLSAIAKGLLYSPDCMLGAWDLVKDWNYEERLRLNDAVHRTALATPVRSYRVQDLARELIDIAEEGLRRQNCLDARGENETIYLERARDYARRGKCPAELVLERWNSGWPRDATNLVRLTAYRLPDAA
jgi:glutamate--cysteine ligase